MLALSLDICNMLQDDLEHFSPLLSNVCFSIVVAVWFH